MNVDCYIIGWYNDSLRKSVSIYLEKSVEGGGGVETTIFKCLEFDSKISYTMFLHDYYEISTVRTLAQY